MELIFHAGKIAGRELVAALRHEVRMLRRERFRCRLVVIGNGILRVRVAVGSDNERRYVRLRLGRVVGTFLTAYALDIRAEDFFSRKGLWDAKVQDVIKRYLREARDLLTPLRSEIIVRLNEYLSTEDWVDLKGFLRFRLKNLDAFITAVIWRLADQALLEQEWVRLVSFLRRYRQNRNAGIRQVHCLPGDAGSFILCDKRGGRLENGVQSEMQGDDLGNEDLLIGTLLTMGVHKVTMHGCMPSAHALKLLRAVFYLKECTGCSICRKKEVLSPKS
ncbi:MAG: sporulation protein YtxC [Bacillota bacterium]